MAGATNEIQGQTSFVDVGALRGVHKKAARPLTTFITGVNSVNRQFDNAVNALTLTLDHAVNGPLTAPTRLVNE